MTTEAVESDFLKYRRAELAAAEQALVKARENMRNTAERHGLATAGIFSESQFIWRSTGERWRDEARREGAEKGRQEILDLFKAADGDLGAFAHLANTKFDDDSSTEKVVAVIIAAGARRRGEVV
jgi:hypothetical protein